MVAEYGLTQGIMENAFGGSVGFNNHCDELGSEIGWKRQDWLVDNRIRQECLEAEERAKEAAEDSDHSVLCFDAYGANWIKNDGKSYFIGLSCHSIFVYLICFSRSMLIPRCIRPNGDAIGVVPDPRHIHRDV